MEFIIGALWRNVNRSWARYSFQRYLTSLIKLTADSSEGLVTSLVLLLTRAIAARAHDEYKLINNTQQ